MRAVNKFRIDIKSVQLNKLREKFLKRKIIEEENLLATPIIKPRVLGLKLDRHLCAMRLTTKNTA